MIAKPITYLGQEVILVCDANCNKAWGRKTRPIKNEDYMFDSELGKAPEDPGTYEGGHSKPKCHRDRLNKWCCRECERSKIVRYNEEFDLDIL
ncbi:MAG: hypothetical protein EOM05_10860 [Clostridia bacterium]|nr:hypothetical protein [Clostridia bacterium]